MRPEQNGRRLAERIFKYNFVKENFCISIQISMKFATKGSIHTKFAFG